MSVEVWRFARTGFSHENAALLHLARQLEPLNEHFLIIANPVLGGQELDGLIFKQDMVFVIEFKKVCGPVTGTLRGPWTALCDDGALLPLNEGRDENPFQQVQRAYFAALNFLNANRDTFLTASEAAVTDFKKIRNVLILDPEYNAEASHIDLGKEAWKLIIVGLHNEVADPFVTQRHEKINLTPEQMRTIARDVLCCAPDEDFARLLHSETQTEAATPEAFILLEPFETAPDIHHRETLEARFDSPVAPRKPVDLSVPVQRVRDFSRTLLDQAQETKKVLAEKLEEERARQYAAHRVDYEELLDALRQAAEKSVHSLPPNTYVANYYAVRLDPPAFEHLAELLERYQLHAETQLNDYIIQQGYELEPKHKPMTVRIERDDAPKAPRIEVQAAYRPARPVASLEDPHGQSRELFPGDSIVIGRGATVDFRVCDERERPVVSREHCRIIAAADGKKVAVHDNDSTNHLYVNGVRVTVAALNDGDVLLLGRNQRDEEGPTLRVRVFA